MYYLYADSAIDSDVDNTLLLKHENPHILLKRAEDRDTEMYPNFTLATTPINYEDDEYNFYIPV